MNDFLHGAVTMASASVFLFFLRYWRSTRDRLFALFSAAFGLLTIHWLLIGTLPALVTPAHTLRFAAFLLIAVAVFDKNRRPQRKRGGGPQVDARRGQDRERPDALGSSSRHD